MLKPANIILPVVVMLMFTKCRSSPTDLDKKFRQVDSSLQNVSHVLDDSTAILYNAIQAKKLEDPGLAASAASVYDKFKAAVHLIDSLKQLLSRQDTAGTSTELPEKLMGGVTGITLKAKLDDFYGFSYARLSKSNISKAKNIFRYINAESSPRDFISTYFKSTPTVGVLTILSKFRSDCNDLCLLSLKDIKQQLTP